MCGKWGHTYKGLGDKESALKYSENNVRWNKPFKIQFKKLHPLKSPQGTYTPENCLEQGKHCPFKICNYSLLPWYNPQDSWGESEPFYNGAAGLNEAELFFTFMKWISLSKFSLNPGTSHSGTWDTVFNGFTLHLCRITLHQRWSSGAY